MKHFPALAALLVMPACASINDALTPSMQVSGSEIAGATIVRQTPVSTDSSTAEAPHTLGFEWSENTPDTVYITAGAQGTADITGVEFNADGRVIDDIRMASATTEFGDWSTRRFAMPWSAFLVVAQAKSVEMKVVRNNGYSVSSFGPNHDAAVVNSKLTPFASKVRELRQRRAAPPT